MYYGGFSYKGAYSLPIWQRIWFIERINKEFKTANKNTDMPQSRGAHHNTAEARQMMGRARAQVPSNLRRFT